MLGKNINGYKVEQFLGKGGFGEVYKATKNGPQYAIKFIREDFIYKDYQKELLRREIAALRKVKSKYTVTFFEDGTYTEGYTTYRYIVMELVEGLTLREILDKYPKPWPQDKAIKLITYVLKGLSDIHKENIIHRDLKPENIKITPNKEVKILDYGLSKIIDYSSITQTGVPVGSFFYMSPEQVKGEKPLKCGSDFYAMGVVLYELLTGQILFYPSTNAEIIHKTVNVKPPYPTALNPKISNNIENVILKLLEKEVYQRYRTIDEIIEALNQKPVPTVAVVTDRIKFYPRVIQNDTNILQDFLKNNEIDGADFPINLHAQYKTISSLLRKRASRIDFFADPSTNRMVYTNFRKTKGLRELPYAPSGYDPLTTDDFNSQKSIQEYAQRVIELQITNGCNVLTAPFFYFDNTSDEWFVINLKLLRESVDYVRKKYPQYKVSGAICTQAEILCRPKERKTIIEDFGNSEMDFCQFYIDKISETIVDAQLYNFISTALGIKNYNKARIVSCRVPVVALGLLTIGFDAITSGLGVLDSFNKGVIIKEEDITVMPTKYYFPDLLISVTYSSKTRMYQDIVTQESDLKKQLPQLNIKLKCDCSGCMHTTMSDTYQKPRLHFLHAIKRDIDEMNSISSAQRKSYFIKRIDKAYDLQQKLIGRGIRLQSPTFLKTWKEILMKF